MSVYWRAVNENTTNKSGEKTRILIIEDDQFLAEIIMNNLSHGEPWDLDLAMTGKDGLDKMRAAKPDLLLLDLVLPGMDGYEVLRQMKADQKLAGIRVLILSNLGQKDEIAKGVDLGAEDFFIKANHDVDDIRSKVRELLAKGAPSKN